MADLTRQARTLVTLGVLGVLFVAGLAWGWSRITEPYPAPLQTAPCDARVIAAGDDVTPQQVTVSVLNAGGRAGLAGDTLDDLVQRSFGEGDIGNAPASAATSAAVIWASPDNAGAQLVASHLGGDVEVVDQPSSYLGITVLVGEGFGGVTDGDESLTAAADSTVCVPN